MDYSAEFLNEPTEEDISRFFALEREMNTLALSPGQRTRKEEILKNITQFLGSRNEFTRFLRQLETLRDEVKAENSRVEPEQAVAAAPAGNARFNAYLEEFNRADEEKLRQMIRDELERLPKDHLVFLYTATVGLARCFKPSDRRPPASGR